MSEFEQTETETYVSGIFDALVKKDKKSLRDFGQTDGFVNNIIRKQVWSGPLTLNTD